MSEQWLDLVYGDYHGWKGWTGSRDVEGETTRALVELRLAGISPPARLLELGYGDGAFLRRAASAGFECSGLERGTDKVEELRAAGIDARAGELDQFKGRTFDLIVAFDVLEHIALPDLIETLRGLAALLDQKGRMVVRFPNMASPLGVANQFGDITHLTALSPGSLAQLARLARLEVVRVANGATVFRGTRGIRALLKPIAWAVRKLIELLLSVAYYGQITPLSPSVVVILRKMH